MSFTYSPAGRRKRCSPGGKKISAKGEKLKCTGAIKKRKPNTSCKHGRLGNGYCKKPSKKNRSKQ